ncbi:hypothetical protein MPTK1_6g14740 [Marchantia polymorpha subsp. ruderalis]|uniref:Uncharacterized protein n=2 Tax=Marchantia polymorpha TaxID=3197 RepID=A0AAF6BS36_MARPO|nr:hypothetical protein MARPO_0047s0128 [Marchantia polymorpha]BBN14820.1 hypothetical protein Mp_6g14740 [Marchantia polymorpha subsp. ruderalis]|eukprot:PTQ39164.1 hypothetical protein MARPO_0047s0128 [Marchantia polymorpha]
MSANLQRENRWTEGTRSKKTAKFLAKVTGKGGAEPHPTNVYIHRINEETVLPPRRVNAAFRRTNAPRKSLSNCVRLGRMQDYAADAGSLASDSFRKDSAASVAKSRRPPSSLASESRRAGELLYVASQPDGRADAVKPLRRILSESRRWALWAAMAGGRSAVGRSGSDVGRRWAFERWGLGGTEAGEGQIRSCNGCRESRGEGDGEGGQGSRERWRRGRSRRRSRWRWEGAGEEHGGRQGQRKLFSGMAVTAWQHARRAQVNEL